MTHEEALAAVADLISYQRACAKAVIESGGSNADGYAARIPVLDRLGSELAAGCTLDGIRASVSEIERNYLPGMGGTATNVRLLLKMVGASIDLFERAILASDEC
jgi:hypothetical protein